MSMQSAPARPGSIGSGLGFLWAIPALLAASGIVYLAAGISGLLFAAGWPHQGFSQISHSIVLLASHPGKPKLAWPVADQGRISGPGPFYTVLGFLLVLGIAAAYRLMIWWLRY